MISGMEMCKEAHKKLTLKYMNSLNFKTIAIGDSLNDLGMLEEADVGILFKSSNSIKSQYSQYFSCDTYSELLIKINQTFNK